MNNNPPIKVIIDTNLWIKSQVNDCRDAKDNYLLALAKDSQADFLVTGDQDLLSLQQFEIIMRESSIWS